MDIPHGAITVLTGVSGSGKSSLAFDTILRESQRRFFYTLSNYTRQFLDLGTKPKVRKIIGLSPSIALEQNETMPSSRATVASHTDLGELLGVMFARFGKRLCPDHGIETASKSLGNILQKIEEDYDNKMVALCTPLATQKKGNFHTKLSDLAKKGYLRAWIDGELVSLTPAPELAKEKKHTIKLIIDYVTVQKENALRIKNSLKNALEEGEGFAEIYVAKKDRSLDLESGQMLSNLGGCPTCGFSWPKLDPRYFNPNSLGACSQCQGRGHHEEQPCAHCKETGLDKKISSIKLLHKSMADFYQGTLADFLPLFKKEALHASENLAFHRVRLEIVSILEGVCSIGLGYLQLGRRIKTLSGGESQRLKITQVLSEKLCGILYILDEPSQGMHPKEIKNLLQTLKDLKEAGNTILLVDHDEELMRHADLIIDLGPGGGIHGGELMASFTPSDAFLHVKKSITARYLVEAQERKKVRPVKHDKEAKFLILSHVFFRNLKINRVRFQLEGINVVTGVSGAGKSSLVNHVLVKRLEAFLNDPASMPNLEVQGNYEITSFQLIDRSPLSKNSVSLPATYLDIFTYLRELYSSLTDAQILGLQTKSFSLHSAGGRCEACKGRGEVVLSMRFLPDAYVRCTECQGMRYKAYIEEVRYNGLSLSQVLNLTIDEALTHFKQHRKIVQKLKPAADLGLNYLKLGQPMQTVSGGEAQRLKLVPYLSRRNLQGSLFILDEPTRGLHFSDVELLMKNLRRLVENGASIMMTEHNKDVILASDWLIELGPEAAERGGLLIREGAMP